MSCAESACCTEPVTHCNCLRALPQVRKRELQLISKTAVIKTLNLCLVFAVPPVIALVIFATYAYTKGPLTPAMAFVVLSLFNTLRFPLVVLPKALRGSSGQHKNSSRSYSSIWNMLAMAGMHLHRVAMRQPFHLACTKGTSVLSSKACLGDSCLQSCANR